MGSRYSPPAVAGPTGPTGPTGSAGSAGATGATGPQGPALPILFGNAGSGTSTSLRFLGVECSDTSVTTTTWEWVTTVAFTANEIRVHAVTAGTGTGSFDFTLYKNSAPSSLTVNMAATSTDATASGSVSFAVGDIVSCALQGTGSITGTTGRLTVSIGIA